MKKNTKSLILIITSFLMTQIGMASDDWLCHGDNVSSIKRGNSIYACGSAKGHDEQDAKETAFLAAQNEFHSVCDNSADCRNKKRTVEPKRTECESIGPSPSGGRYFKFKCYRLVVFTMED
jgi:hypothetical protein